MAAKRKPTHKPPTPGAAVDHEIARLTSDLAAARAAHEAEEKAALEANARADRAEDDLATARAERDEVQERLDIATTEVERLQKLLRAGNFREGVAAEDIETRDRAIVDMALRVAELSAARRHKARGDVLAAILDKPRDYSEAIVDASKVG